MFRHIRIVISWFFRLGEHAIFAADIAKFFGLWKMVISFELGLLTALAEWYETSPFWFGAVGFTVTLVIINVVWGLYNKWQISEHKMCEAASSLIGSPFQSQWPLAQEVFDYVAFRLGISKHEACLALQRSLLDGSIKARGPINSAPVAMIDGEFWRFAPPDQEGRANNLSSFDCLPWFEVWTKDVLAIWPANRKATKW
jgi:hypothetical protein